MTQVPREVIESLRAVEGTAHAVTIGNFDGVHRGHVYLIRRMIETAAEHNVRSLVVTFEPHPTAVLRPDVPFARLTAPEHKLHLIGCTGIDDVVVVPFDRDFASLSPEDFLDLLTRTVQPVAVFVGEGFRFGRARSGDGETIRRYGNERGFETFIVPRLKDGATVISSSSIREALRNGDVGLAAQLLGRRYRLRGTVEHGEARGRELGFPTANLLLPDNICIPSDGIYAAYAHIPDRGLGPLPAMVYIGTRPTFSGEDRLVEVNILDFSGDLYARDLEVEFVTFIRGDAIFESPETLARQMLRDEVETRRMLAEESPEADPCL